MESYIDKKFYVPEIEEFHVGFEYEYIGYSECVFSTDMSISFMDYLINNGRIRVKYLNREDIESLGFIARREQFGDTYLYRLDLVKPLFSHHPELDTLYFAYYHHNARCILFLQKIKKFGRDEHRPEIQLFNGYIRNKSELKRILKQIGV